MKLARRMLASVRNYDHVGRYGGEEFLIVLGDSSASTLAISAERVRACIAAKPVETDAGPIPVTISLGVLSVAAAALMKSEDVLRAADAALYRAKTNGRNRVETATGRTNAAAR